MDKSTLRIFGRVISHGHSQCPFDPGTEICSNETSSFRSMFGRNKIFMERPNSHWEVNLEMPRSLSAGKKWRMEKKCVSHARLDMEKDDEFGFGEYLENNHVGFRWFGCNVGFMFSTFFHFQHDFFASFPDSDILLCPMSSTTSTNYSKQKLTAVFQMTTLPGDVAKLP